MRVATVTVPRNWEPCESVVKQCLEFYTLLALPQFQVNVTCQRKSGRIQIADLGGLDEEQDWILKFAVSDFNFYMKNNHSQDPCKAVIAFHKQLDKRRNRQADNSRNVLRGKVRNSADRG